MDASIVVEILLAIGTFVGGMAFWLIRKKRQLIAMKAQDAGFLDRLLQSLDEAKPFSSRTRILEPLPDGWWQNVGFVSEVQIKTERRIKTWAALLAAVAISIGAFFTWWFAIVNFGLFLSASAVPLGEVGYRSAVSDMMEIVQLLYRWHRESPEECGDFVRQSHGLQVLYESVKKLP